MVREVTRIAAWGGTNDDAALTSVATGNDRDRHGQTLFIDAHKLGTMRTRTRRVPAGDTAGVDGQPPPPPSTDSDIGRIATTVHRWGSEPAPADWVGLWVYDDVPSFCKSAWRAAIAKRGFVLTPGRYVGVEEQADDGEPFADQLAALVAELEGQFTDGAKLDAAIRHNLARLAPDTGATRL